MNDWLAKVQRLDHLDAGSRASLAKLAPVTMASGTVIFQPGDAARNFPIVLSGCVGVYLTGATGREILLYAVTPGETCVQTTLGLLGNEEYSAEAIAETDVELVIIPKAVFEELLGRSANFRSYVFGAFAERMQSLMRVLESVAFDKIEKRLATVLADRADSQGRIVLTHQELATAIGSVREVVSRRLEIFARSGLVELERGRVRVVDRDALLKVAESLD